MGRTVQEDREREKSSSSSLTTLTGRSDIIFTKFGFDGLVHAAKANVVR
jgi:hypothetical protein